MVFVGADLGWLALIGTDSSVIAPPFHRSTRSARPSVWSRCRLMVTSSSRVRSSCLRSLSVVVGADHNRSRSSPRARMACFSCGVRVFGRAVSRRASSASASACCRARFHSLSRGRGPTVAGFRSRRPGNGARLCRPGSGLVRPAVATGPAPHRGRPRVAGRRPGRLAARPARAPPGTPRRPRRRSRRHRPAGAGCRAPQPAGRCRCSSSRAWTWPARRSRRRVAHTSRRSPGLAAARSPPGPHRCPVRAPWDECCCRCGLGWPGRCPSR